jgi:multidrug efflux pump subunit AcrA (membrane-fusion protein)
MKPHPWLALGLAGAALLLAACGEKASDAADHDHPDHAGDEAAAESGVAFHEGRGLQLAPAVVRALGVRTVKAEEHPLAAERTITAQVFATLPRTLASARVPVDEAEALRDTSLAGATLVRIDAAPAAATGLADAVFALDAPGAHRVGDFVTIPLRGHAARVLAVPRSAILDGAAGTFVYVVSDGAYRRTPVRLGARSGTLVEIVDGLRAGDDIVAAPVEQLWLTELRLTRGGGHSH